MPGNPRKRLERIERELAEIAKREALRNCNCRDFTIAAAAEAFAAEMNQSCPAHGFRRLGKIHVFQVATIGGKGKRTERSLGVPELVQEYKRRLARYQQQLLEQDDPEDL